MQRAKPKAKEKTRVGRTEISNQVHHIAEAAHPGVTAAAPRGPAGTATRLGIPGLIAPMNRYATIAINQGTKGTSAPTRGRREEAKVKAKMGVAGKERG